MKAGNVLVTKAENALISKMGSAYEIDGINKSDAETVMKVTVHIIPGRMVIITFVAEQGEEIAMGIEIITAIDM